MLYNGRPMTNKRTVTALVMAALPTAMALGAVEPRADARPDEARVATVQHAEDYGRELLSLCNDMWFLLSGVADKADADAAASRFRELVDKALAVAEKLYDPTNPELLEMAELHASIAESMEDLTQEFNSLCALRCYGAEKLIAQFRYSVENGMFSDDYLVYLEEPRELLTDAETRSELLRYKRLVEPDRAVLDTLRAVKDARTADDAAIQLSLLSERLKKLSPQQDVADRPFSPESDASVRLVYAPIEPLLWGIRAEIVRIASLPDYDEAAYDSFSEALQDVYIRLGEAHCHWFDSVFDASFHVDLDEALQEAASLSK